MSVQVENLEKNMVKLTIEVPAEEMVKILNALQFEVELNDGVLTLAIPKPPHALRRECFRPADWR